jgi:outer membrane biosynthesis protein TonB
MDTGSAEPGTDGTDGTDGTRGTDGTPGTPGPGDGTGSTRNGIGFGAGGGIAGGGDVAGVAVPPPPRPSMGRPARLRYPTREADIDQSILFVARLTIDRDGYVVGAHIVRGHGGVLDDDAERAVWRFRFHPALDDDGRPTQTTVEQVFMVQ